MKQIFRTYNSLNASIFDLIDGSFEVKQTTGLAFLLANDSSFLNSFLCLPEIKILIGKINIKNYSKIIVHSELISKAGKRVDIAIQLYKNGIPDFAIIIEAKNVNKNTSFKNVLSQVEGYINSKEFSEFKEFQNIYGCALTKNDLLINSGSITSISWNRIINLLAGKKTGLAKEYLDFLIRIKGVMKFYEREVFSVPAKGSFQYQYDYPHIYECPNVGRNFTSMKKPLYMTFRKHLGVMEKLFGVDDIIIMNPHTDFEAFLKNSSYSQETKERIKKYCDDFWTPGNYDDNEKQFFVLSLTNQIELKHHPKPAKNNSFRAYYTLSELLNPDKKIVETV